MLHLEASQKTPVDGSAGASLFSDIACRLRGGALAQDVVQDAAVLHVVELVLGIDASQQLGGRGAQAYWSGAGQSCSRATPS